MCERFNVNDYKDNNLEKFDIDIFLTRVGTTRVYIICILIISLQHQLFFVADISKHFLSTFFSKQSLDNF